MPTLSPEDVGKFVGLGGTFHSHQAEKDRTYRWPDFWLVPPEGVVSDGEPIELPARAADVSTGSELTAVIGEDIWQADEAEAWDSISGFTVSNDVTATGDWPGWSDPEHGMITGVGYKCFPTFSPLLGDVVEKRDREHYEDLHVEVRVDGEVATSGSTAQMAFSIGELVSFASNITPLHENDVVALGEPGNCSIYLDDADEVTCTVESIGELTNPVERLPE